MAQKKPAPKPSPDAASLLKKIGKAFADLGEETTKSVGKSTKRKPIVSPKLIPPLTQRPQKKAKDTPKSRKATREAYLDAPPVVRKVVREQQSKQGDTTRKQSKDMNRAERYVREAQAAAKSGESIRDMNTAERERITKGLRLLEARRKRDELRDALAAPARALEGLEPVAPRRSSGIGGSLGDILTNIAGGFAGAQNRGSQGDAVAQGVRKELEGRYGPLDDATRLAIRGTADGTTKLLSQLNRPASASAGAAVAALEGKNPISAAGRAFVSNDRSYAEVARKAGLDGFDADVVGFLGDVALDPTTYATLGASVPSKATASAVREAAQRGANKQFEQVRKWADREGLDAGDPLYRDALAAVEREREAFLARKLAPAERKARKAQEKNGREARSVQVGVRVGKQDRTVSVVPQAVARRVGDAARRVQQAPRVNDAATAVNPRSPKVGVTPEQQRVVRDLDRRARGEAQRVMDELTRTAFRVREVTKGDAAQHRRIVDAIEGDTIDALPERLRAVAAQVRDVNAASGRKLSEVLGREIQLSDLMLAPRELKALADQVGAVARRAETRASRDAERAEGKADGVAQLVAFASRSGNPSRDPIHVRLEREAGAAERAATQARDARMRAEDKLAVERRRAARAQQREGGVPPVQADRLRRALADLDDARDRAAQARVAARGARADAKTYRADPVTPAQRADLDARTKQAGVAAGRAKDAKRLAEDLERVGAGDAATERAAVAKLRSAVGELARERSAQVVRRNVAQVFAEVRAGGATADAFPELADALRAAEGHRVEAGALVAAGDRAGARAAQAKGREARQVIDTYRKLIGEQAEHALAEDGAQLVGGRLARLDAAVTRAEERVSKDTPDGYVPRVTAQRLEDSFARDGRGRRRGGKASAENARVQNRERLDQMDETVRSLYSDDLPLLEAAHGVSVATRLYRARMAQGMFRAFGQRPTREVLAADPSVVVYQRRAGDLPVRLEDDRAVREAIERGEEPAGVVLLPEQFDRILTERYDAADPGEINRAVRAGIRRFKELNTIARPGFFVNTAVGNSWQLYLADAQREIGQQVRTVARLKAEELKQKKGTSALTRVLDRVGENRRYFVDGREMTTAELLEEGTRYGAARTGSRIGYALDGDLRPEEIVSRQLARPKQAIKWASTKAGNLSEDLDDATRGVLYLRARTKLGLSPQDATEHVYRSMIDYGDLTRQEQRYLKVVMPFYVYTARNVPIQIKRLMERPGKLANASKFTDLLAETAGLPEDWQSMLSETDQERMMFPVPGLTVGGEQMFRDLRLPSSDLARPAQLLDGPEGVGRMLKRLGADVGPYLRGPAELGFNRRLDFDRPIYGADTKPAEAGALLEGLEKLAGWRSDRDTIDPRTGEKYNTTSNVADYAIRLLGSYPSLALGVGQESADRGGRTFPIRLADSLVGQGSQIPRPAETILNDSVYDDVDDAYDKRERLERTGKRGSREWYRNADQIEDLQAGVARLRDLLGDPRGVDGVRKAQDRRTNPRDPVAIRALEHRIRKLTEITPGR